MYVNNCHNLNNVCYATNYNTKGPFRMTPLTVCVPDMSQFTQDFGHSTNPEV